MRYMDGTLVPPEPGTPPVPRVGAFGQLPAAAAAEDEEGGGDDARFRAFGRRARQRQRVLAGGAARAAAGVEERDGAFWGWFSISFPQLPPSPPPWNPFAWLFPKPPPSPSPGASPTATRTGSPTAAPTASPGTVPFLTYRVALGADGSDDALRMCLVLCCRTPECGALTVTGDGRCVLKSAAPQYVRSWPGVAPGARAPVSAVLARHLLPTQSATASQPPSATASPPVTRSASETASAGSSPSPTDASFPVGLVAAVAELAQVREAERAATDAAALLANAQRESDAMQAALAGPGGAAPAIADRARRALARLDKRLGIYKAAQALLRRARELAAGSPHGNAGTPPTPSQSWTPSVAASDAPSPTLQPAAAATWAAAAPGAAAGAAAAAAHAEEKEEEGEEGGGGGDARFRALDVVARVERAPAVELRGALAALRRDIAAAQAEDAGRELRG